MVREKILFTLYARWTHHILVGQFNDAHTHTHTRQIFLWHVTKMMIDVVYPFCMMMNWQFDLWNDDAVVSFFWLAGWMFSWLVEFQKKLFWNWNSSIFVCFDKVKNMSFDTGLEGFACDSDSKVWNEKLNEYSKSFFFTTSNAGQKGRDGSNLEVLSG